METTKLDSLFVNLYKYRETDETNQLENYITELFSYLLNMLAEIKNPLLKNLLQNGLDIQFEDSDYESFVSETQKEYKNLIVYDDIRIARPDIEIRFSNKKYLIENKIGAPINIYKTKSGILYDQIYLYQKISTDGIRTLSKNVVYSKSLKKNNKRYWSKIAGILKNSELKTDFIIRGFIYLLEENGMGEKLLFRSGDNAPLFALIDFLDNVIDFEEMGYKNDSKAINASGDFVGYDIRYSNASYIWIGVYKDFDEIVVESYADSTKLEIKPIGTYGPFENQIYAKIDLQEFNKLETFEEQKELFDDWIKKNKIKELLEESYNSLNNPELDV